MAWLQQLQTDPALQGKLDWAAVTQAHERWDYEQQGLTPEGAALVTLATAYFTAGAASGVGAAAGASAGSAATAAGASSAVAAATGSVVSGAVAAGVTTLASQAAVALINNKGDIGAALHELGSSANVKSLLAGIVTGGVLGGLNLNPTGSATPSAGASKFVEQLGTQLKAGAAKAVIDTAINGGSLEDSLQRAIKGALLDTLAAQAANAIGDAGGNAIGDASGDSSLGASIGEAKLGAFANKVAHAVAGCAIGAASTDNSSGCSAGALGGALGELSAELYGARPDTVPFASMLSAIGAAVAGQDVNVAAAAGGNAAANNFLKHTQAALMQQELDACRTKASGCTDDQVVAIFGKFRDASNQNIEAVQACIKAGNVACVQSLEAQAASASEVSDALPLGYGKLESELVARQENVNNHGSFNPYSVFGTDAQQAQEVAIFRSDNCANLSAAACDSLVQQALDDRMERFAVLTAVGAIVPGAGMGLRRLTLPKSPGGNYAASPRQSQGQFNDSLPIQRIVYNGVELEPSLPPPAAGYGYAPSSLKGATTSNLANSHVSGFLAEIRLANEIAAQGRSGRFAPTARRARS